MKYYLNIRVLPNSEFLESILINSLFSELHKKLVEFGDGKIGVSFPEFNKNLGSLLRLHGQQSALQRLKESLWTTGYKDYLTISEVAEVPEKVSYRVVNRIQPKKNIERLMRRSVRKGWITEEEAINNLKDKKEVTSLSHPYVRLKSGSSGQTFLLFIEHGPLMENAKEGFFTSYGLSSDGTIPWF